MNKKAEWKIEPGIVWVILIIALVIVTMWIGSWECRNDEDCGENSFCNVKHLCYKPANETTVIKTENKYLLASFILGICIIIAAIIIKTEDFKLLHHVHRFRKK